MNEDQEFTVRYLTVLLFTLALVWALNPAPANYCDGPAKPNNCLYIEGV